MEVELHSFEWIDNKAIGDFSKEIHIWNNTIPSSLPNAINVLTIFAEPEHFRIDNRTIINRHKEFDLILTHDPSILALPNARLFSFGGCFVNDAIIRDKQFKTSFICGGKTNTHGHNMRIDLWNRQHLLRTTKLFLNSKNTPLITQITGDGIVNRKADLFEDSMFHIAIENTNIDGYFSEKLIDCFYTKTVPLYWGCPNVGNYFDKDGMILFENIDHLINIINNLTIDDYNKRITSIKQNYQNQKLYNPKWNTFEDRIGNALREVFK